MCQATFLTICAGEWLQASASIVGVALTVWATLWLAKRDERQQHARFTQACKRLSYYVQCVIDIDPMEVDEGRCVAAIMFQKRLIDAIEQYRYLRSESKLYNMNVWQAVRELDPVLDEQTPILERELRVIRDLSDEVEEKRSSLNTACLAAMAIREKTNVLDAWLGH